MTIRRNRCTRLWCQQCGREMDVVQAEILTATGHRLGDGAQVNKWHSFAGPDGTLWVCLGSLMKSI